MMDAVRGILGSKKFVAGLASAIAAAVAHFGWDVDPKVILAILSPVLVAIFGQGVADTGKEKAKTEAAGQALLISERTEAAERQLAIQEREVRLDERKAKLRTPAGIHRALDDMEREARAAKPAKAPESALSDADVERIARAVAGIARASQPGDRPAKTMTSPTSDASPKP